VEPIIQMPLQVEISKPPKRQEAFAAGFIASGSKATMLCLNEHKNPPSDRLFVNHYSLR